MSSASNKTDPTRPVAINLSSNFQGSSPLSNQSPRSDAITAKNSSRPNFRKYVHSDRDISPTKATIALRKYIPRTQIGEIPIREDQHHPNLPLFDPSAAPHSQTKFDSQKSDPNKKGLNRSANFNLLIAGFENNLKRSLLSSQRAEKELIQDLENHQSSNN